MLNNYLGIDAMTGSDFRRLRVLRYVGMASIFAMHALSPASADGQFTVTTAEVRPPPRAMLCYPKEIETTGESLG